MEWNSKIIVKLLFVVVLVYVSIQTIVGNEPYILSALNLIFHEAGHPVFALFGEFIGFLGGTLGQLIVPLMFAVYFILHKDIYASAVLFWWFGQNFIGISIYIADARSQVLPLLGGSAVQHDWGYMLPMLGIQMHDHLIARIVESLGIGIMFVSLCVAILSCFPDVIKQLNKHLKMH